MRPYVAFVPRGFSHFPVLHSRPSRPRPRQTMPMPAHLDLRKRRRSVPRRLARDRGPGYTGRARRRPAHTRAPRSWTGVLARTNDPALIFCLAVEAAGPCCRLWCPGAAFGFRRCGASQVVPWKRLVNSSLCWDDLDHYPSVEAAGADQDGRFWTAIADAGGMQGAAQRKGISSTALLKVLSEIHG